MIGLKIASEQHSKCHAGGSLLNYNSCMCGYRKKIIIGVNINMICVKHRVKEIYILSIQKYIFSEKNEIVVIGTAH